MTTRRRGDVDDFGWLAAAELGWSVLAGPRLQGPARQGDPNQAGEEIYDRLRAAAFVNKPRPDAEGNARVSEDHAEYFSYARSIRNPRFDDQERATLRAAWAGPECQALTGLTIEDCLNVVGTTLALAMIKARALGHARLTAGDGLLLSVTSAEVAAAAELDPGKVEDLLEMLATELGSQSLPDVHSDTAAIRQAPLLKEDQRLLCTAGDSLLRALQPTLERLLVDSHQPIEAWQQRRGKWLEGQAIEALSRFLRPELALGAVTHGPFELDGLLVVDDVVVLIEAKSGAVRTQKALNDPKRFRQDLERLVLKPIAQLREARKAILRGETLTDDQGRRFALTGPKQRLAAVIVTLEQFSPLASRLWRLKRMGMVAAKEPLPWMLSLAHLQTICELLEYPAQLIDFLDRRQGLDERVLVPDELDCVLAYLRWGLDFSAVLDEQTTSVTLPNANDEINPWIFGKRGWTHDAPRQPQMEVSAAVELEVRSRLRELDEIRPAGWVSDSLRALEWARQNTTLQSRIEAR